MRKLIILIGIMLSCSLMGQVTTNTWFAHAAEGGGGGTNMISNGTFNDSSDWSFILAGWSISGGVASWDFATNYSKLYQTDADMISSITESTDYTLKFTVSNSTSGIRMKIEEANNGVEYISITTYTNGDYEIDWTSPATLTNYGIVFKAYTSGGSSGDLDNIELITR